MKILSLFFCYFLPATTLFAQIQNGCSDSTEVYALQSPLTLYKRLRLSNGDFLLYNIRSNSSAFNYESDYLVKVDSNGNYKQGYQIKITNNSYQRLNFVAASSDGGFVLAGDRHAYDYINNVQSFQHVVILRFDLDMKLQWQKEFVPSKNQNYDTSTAFTISSMDYNNKNELFLSVSPAFFSSANNASNSNLTGGVNFFFA